MPSADSLVVVFGTGGTIAGAARRPGAQLGYEAGALEVEALVAAVPALAGQRLETHSLARLDSSDMDLATWLALADAVAHALARPEVAGVVVTHGTDTLEETAAFLHATVAAGKPVVLTAAMRPATAASPDGPQNLLDAVTLAAGGASHGLHGVLLMFGGTVHAGLHARKLHGWRLDAFSSGDAPPLALVQDGRLRRLADAPPVDGSLARARRLPAAEWPRVEIVTSHAGADGDIVRALAAAGVDGLVIAGTGNGSVHHALRTAAAEARAEGVVVWRSTRCTAGGIVEPADDPRAAERLPHAGDATPAQARVRLLLELACAKLDAGAAA